MHLFSALLRPHLVSLAIVSYRIVGLPESRETSISRFDAMEDTGLSIHVGPNVAQCSKVKIANRKYTRWNKLLTSSKSTF
jgi:hypothetical protein